MTKLRNDGLPTTDVEVVSIAKHGFWLNLDGWELFSPLTRFPWFADAPLRTILNVRSPSLDHIHWPEFDVDLTLEYIEHPERFPLRSDSSPATTG